jgi:hypothetical protein
MIILGCIISLLHAKWVPCHNGIGRSHIGDGEERLDIYGKFDYIAKAVLSQLNPLHQTPKPIISRSVLFFPPTHASDFRVVPFFRS